MRPGSLRRVLLISLGIAMGLAVSGASAWILSTHLRARRAAPSEKALLDSLKEKGKTDATVQPALQAELDRQLEAAKARRKVYDRGGAVLLISGLVLVVWLRWFRPGKKDVLRVRIPRGKSAPVEDVPARAPAAAIPLKGRQGDAACACAEAEKDIDLSAVDEIVRREGRTPDAAIPILQAIQARFRYLPEAALRRVTELTEITPSQIAGVSSFYSQFRHSPMGEHILRVCEGTACHVAGAVEITSELRRCLGIAPGSDTDPAGRFTIERVACLGSCSLAPVVTIDEKIYGHVSALAAEGLIRGFLDLEARRKARGGGKAAGRASRRSAAASVAAGAPEFRIGVGSCGIASGALEVLSALEDAVRAEGGRAVVKHVGCCGLCHREPLIEVVEGGRSVLYGNVKPGEALRIVRGHVRPRGPAALSRRALSEVRLRLFDDGAWKSAAESRFDAAPYFGKQRRIVLENCGAIDPLSFEEYRARDGYKALERCLRELKPQEIIEKIRLSGLRGRGGAGFPTGQKWDIARKAQGPKKFVICNGDEGDPGAFMDRAVLEADPHRVIEGLAIAAWAIGADEGFFYVRREYPIAVRHVRSAIARAEEMGYLGKGILGTGFGLKLQVREGAGAFVCGEETALIQSIEGFRGMPRLRPPFPAMEGLWKRPTLINNVETLACIPWIIRHGPESFAALGTEGSKGTKVFSLAGKVRRGGLIEVPMGITIREIVEEIGGGMKDGRSFKAVLIGGPSGGCIPARMADTRVDYGELTRTGAIMGSGGLVVLDDRDCAVEIARYFLHFTQDESCGKCTFCRVGTKRMLEILERICAGKGKPGDLATLEELSDRVKRGSLCGLGQTAPNPVITTLRYFREEYEAHIRERRCPAAQCKALIHYTVTDRCTGCTLCAQACPVSAIEARPYRKHEVLDDRCTRCGMCVTACPENAIEVA